MCPVSNEEITEYFDVLSEEWPKFIDKYLEVSVLKRLSKIGQFCGCEYTRLHNCKYWYSRLDHSVATALMTWNFTQDKAQTLGALFHDLGTPAFSHCVDFMLGDALDQESAERDVKDILLGSEELLRCLSEDKVSVEEVAEIQKYTVVENKKPKLCVDRLEGVLHTGLIWCGFWSLEEVAEIYRDVVVLVNEDGEDEIGFGSLEVAERFYDGCVKYSLAMDANEDKFVLQFVADNVRRLIESGVLTHGDLYEKSEAEIIKLIKVDAELRSEWERFERAEVLKRGSKRPAKGYFIGGIKAKKRYVVPLVEVDGKAARLDEVSEVCRELLEGYLEFEDSRFAWIE